MSRLSDASGSTSALWDPWCVAHETHSGAVLLVGDVAFKLKKPVALGFLDFTERDSRLQASRRELELNRRLAPDVYLGLGELRGPGSDAEPAVVMRRMPERYRLSRLVRSGADTTEEVRRIARIVAAFHLRAETGPEVIAEGTRDALHGRWDANLRQAAQFTDGFLDREVLDEIDHLTQAFLDGRKDLFDDRIRRGAIIDGHGDLTPDDVFCLPDGPRLLDCLEFDDRLRYVDRLDDVAFLAMGLEDLGAPHAARVLVETWAEHTADPAPPSLVHHFVAYRAFVRAKVGCLRGAQLASGHVGVRRYADTALAHLRAGAVALVLVGGPPGSGKTTLAGGIADRLGMVTISSDRVRKELAGVDPDTSAAAAPYHGVYDADHTRLTYKELLHRAELLLGRGESVVLDASWTDEEHRSAAREVADRASAELVELRCDVDAVTASTRMRGRHGMSDADDAVATELRRRAVPWQTARAIDTGRPVGECVDAACANIRPHPSPAVLLRRRPVMAPG